MAKPVEALPAHPAGEQSSVEVLPEAVGLCADTFGGRVHVEWDPSAAATPLGQLPFFIEFLKLGGLFDPWVGDCPLTLTSPNAAAKRDILGTLLLAVLAGHQRYAHITALRGDAVNAALLAMRRVMSEDSVRRALSRIDEAAGVDWLQRHLDYTFRPLLGEPWILDVDTTVKPLYGRQEGAVVGYNPHKPGRPSHTYHSYVIAELRLILEVEVQAGNQHASKHSAPGLWALLARIGREAWPCLLRGDCDWGTEAIDGEPHQGLPQLGAFVARLEALLTANAEQSRRERLTWRRVFEVLRSEGYAGGYDSVRRYARRWTERRASMPAAVFVPLWFAPGEAYQFDFSHEVVVLGGVTTTVKVAHLRLCYSRMRLVVAYPRETQEMVFDAHDRAFRLFGGACRRGIYDNLWTPPAAR